MYYFQQVNNFRLVQKFSRDSNYFFFAHSLTQELNLQSQVNITINKVTSGQLTAVMLNSNFDETVRDLIASDKILTLMNCIKGTPAYWKKVSDWCFSNGKTDF